MDEQGIVHCYASDETISGYYTTDIGGTYKIFKLTYTDTTSTSENNSVFSQFALYYTNSCEANTLSLNDEWGNPEYDLESGV